MDYWQLVKGSTYQASSNIFLFPCNTASLPDLTWTFPNGNTATISGSTLNFTAGDSGLGDGSCFGGLQPTATGFANSGPAFFHTYFTIWNQGEATFSYAAYSNIDDTAGTNYGNLPDASEESDVTLSLIPPSATIRASTSLKATAPPQVSSSFSSSSTPTSSTSSHHNAAIPTKAPIARIGAGAAFIAGLVLL